MGLFIKTEKGLERLPQKIVIPKGYRLVPMTEDETTLPLRNGCLRLCKVVRSSYKKEKGHE